MSKIYCVGDSHSILYWYSNIIDHHWFGWAELPVTMFKFINSYIPLFNIVERYKPGDVCKINIKKNDFILFSLGWNDVQKNIYKYQQNNYKEFINIMVEKYFKKIIILTKEFQINPIISCIYPVTENTDGNVNGDINERIKYTIYMNERLQFYANKFNILLFDIYNFISENNRYKKEYMNDDKSHLNYNNKELMQFLENKLLNLCKNYTNPILNL
tara:strand:- start:451 stop:1095 length:645 start_codon:yes stop_codon:yes gene_type:complete